MSKKNTNEEDSTQKKHLPNASSDMAIIGVMVLGIILIFAIMWL